MGTGARRRKIDDQPIHGPEEPPNLLKVRWFLEELKSSDPAEYDRIVCMCLIDMLGGANADIRPVNG